MSAEVAVDLKELRKKDPEAAKKLRKKLNKKKQKVGGGQKKPVLDLRKLVKKDDHSDSEDEEDQKEEIEWSADEVKMDVRMPTMMPNVSEEDQEKAREKFEEAKAAMDDLREAIETFKAPIEDGEGAEEEEAEKPDKRKLLDDDSDEEGDEDSDEEKKNRISRKKRKILTRPTVPSLKNSTHRPDVVELWDTTSPDPHFLVWLKGYRNSVEVPRHWGQKSKYMSKKRAEQKQAFILPEYIEATGIAKIREATEAKEALKTLKQKQREKARPKNKRMDIDYQVLHEAFFKYGPLNNKAARPKLTKYGDLYYEGKENEIRMKQYIPGALSNKLKQALGMVVDTMPPPWLHNMQKVGPPPSYPKLKVPGVNAPIPPGAEYGFQPGGWGKPPVDAEGNPLWGYLGGDYTDTVDEGALWGEFEYKSEDEEEEDEEGIEAPENVQAGIEGAETPAGFQSVSNLGGLTPLGLDDGMTSITSGLTGLQSVQGVPGLPSSVGLHTPGGTISSQTGAVSGALPYQVLQQQAVAPGALANSGQIFGSAATYQLPPAGAAAGANTPGMINWGGGIATPMRGVGGGLMTPGGGASSVTPGQMMSLGEGGAEDGEAFAGDDIRRQLMEQESAAVRARQAAGQALPGEKKGKGGDDSASVAPSAAASSATGAATEKAKKKKKDRFKF
uniref:PSP proline-rich domain-containing protein n=1 Tax=Chromera velia CCMP2878 TaxID=1169474 RepID=A0A0G4G6C4_9ALVE|eukprot:Cvel_20419.t1-p1 / transcript=Cvel_20419.t1 / gene=Cvel_20419 / organism=Chromera_velia_CCMP2878 / gene_product=Pre-mRNA-splicing factor sap145, putative / transcript_product=Pre-mRNA-splicing factor sap145, putative / location=Cvel_scaffold1829:25955-31244(+) / protein_length=671 / sequence_SO=supercontig / SO=protein_coding / is_pseudo=false